MNHDSVNAFRRHFQDAARRLGDQSGVVRLVPDPKQDPARRYFGLFRGIEHFVTDASGGYRPDPMPLSFRVDIPDDYCSCFDGSLQMRVVSVLTPIAHPNVGRPGGILCLGPRFRPGTRLRPLLEHVHRMLSGRTFAAESPLDPLAAAWFRDHLDRVRALRAAPLWRARVADRVVVKDAGEGTR